MDYSSRITDDFIQVLKPDEVFVFGSNLAGFHGGGAARAAFNKFGAIWGQGVGIQGRSYAIPTMQGGVETIAPYVDEFIEYARNHPEKNIITRAMGSRDEALPDFFEIGLSPGDRILMCSDGLSNMVENDELRDIVRENEDVREAVDALVERANYYGGNDNISAVVIAV